MHNISVSAKHYRLEVYLPQIIPFRNSQVRPRLLLHSPPKNQVSKEKWHILKSVWRAKKMNK